jgi:ABC-type branched-subunit amino acid transport system ATPase component
MSGPPAKQLSLLEVSGVTKHFGGLTALAGVDISVEAGEIVGLIGPNGSGKTTLFHCIAGVLRPDGGDVRLRGESLIGAAPHVVCARGVGRTFQLVRVFPQLSTLDNVLAGQSHRAESVVAAFVSASATTVRTRALALLEFVGLAEQATTPASELSYGQQRLLELATVLMGEPDLLLLDEPTAGVNPVLVDRLLTRLREINRRGTTIVLIEHNMEAVMGLSSRMYALAMGGVIAEGTPEALRSNPAVLESYFGPPREGRRRPARRR